MNMYRERETWTLHVQTYTVAHLFNECQVSCILKCDADIHSTKDNNLLNMCSYGYKSILS